MNKASDRIRRVEPNRPDPAAIAAAAERIREGGAVVFPTRGLYGLGADALNPSAVEGVFALKGRPDGKPLPVLVADMADLDRLVAEVSPAGRRLMARFWPGRLTLVMPARPDLPAGLTAGTGKIGVRLCGHPTARALILAAGVPITGTSANVSGGQGCDRIHRLDPALRDRADLILDAGPLAGGPGSTVLDIAGDRPEVLRFGAVGRAELAEALSPDGPDFQNS